MQRMLNLEKENEIKNLNQLNIVVQLKYNRGTVNISDLMIHGAPAFHGLRPDTCHLRR